MTAQVITACDYQGGSLQHAMTLAKALALLRINVRLVNISPRHLHWIPALAHENGIEFVDNMASEVPDAEVSLVVDLLDPYCCEAAVQLANRDSRLILVPTGYFLKGPPPKLPKTAEAIWYVSYDQIVRSQIPRVSKNIEVVRCAVDTDQFCPGPARPKAPPWVLCRHSRDQPEKFSQEIPLILNRLGDTHDVVLHMLGATETIGTVADERIHVYAQDSIPTATFLQQANIWFYAHARYWQETACIAALEACSCGLPVLVSNSGGMREYMVHGITGFLCSTAEEFTAFGRLLMDEPEIYESIATEARRHILARHSIQRLADDLRTLLSIAGQPTSPVLGLPVIYPPP